MSDGGIVLLVVGVWALGLVLWGRRKAARLTAARAQALLWESVARRVGLVVGPPVAEGFTVRPLTARSGKLHFSFRTQLSPRGEPTTEIQITGLSDGSPGLSIEPQVGEPNPPGRGSRPDLEIGVAEFDANYLVQGDPLHSQAVLTAGTRGRLARLLAGVDVGKNNEAHLKVTLRSGELKAVIVHPTNSSEAELGEQLFESLDQVTRLARRLERPWDLAQQLADQLDRRRKGAEPGEAMRLRTLLLLLRAYPQHIATQKVLKVLRDDPSPKLRFVAALAQGEADEPSLLGAVADSANPVELVALAARQLGRQGTVAAVPVLREAAERGPKEVNRVCHQAVAEIQARLEGAEAGQLSLAVGDAGQLSLAGGEAGALALAEDEETHHPTLAEVERS